MVEHDDTDVHSAAVNAADILRDNDAQIADEVAAEDPADSREDSRENASSEENASAIPEPVITEADIAAEFPDDIAAMAMRGMMTVDMRNIAAFDPIAFATEFATELAAERDDAAIAQHLDFACEYRRVHGVRAARDDRYQRAICHLQARAAEWQRARSARAWREENPEAYMQWQDANRALTVKDGLPRP